MPINKFIVNNFTLFLLYYFIRFYKKLQFFRYTFKDILIAVK